MVRKSLWIGLGIDFVGAIVLTIGIFAIFESTTLGYTLIGIGTVMMLVGTFVSIAGGFGSSMEAMDAASQLQWLPGPGITPGGPQLGGPPVGVGTPPTVASPFSPVAQMAAGAAMAGQVVGAASGAQGEKRVRLQQTGVVTDAVVLQARPTGQGAGGSSTLVDLDLNVTPAGRAPYTFSLREAVHPTALARLRPSTPLKVRVDPANSLDVIVDWSASGLPIPV